MRIIGKVCQVNNPVTFSGKHKGSEEYLNRMVKSLEKINHKKIECPY